MVMGWHGLGDLLIFGLAKPPTAVYVWPYRVTLTDAASYTVALTDAATHTATLTDAATHTVTASDS